MRMLPIGLSLALLGCTEHPPVPLPVADASSAEAAALPEPATPAARRELFAAGIRLYESGDLAGAEPLLERVLDEPPPVADHALRHLARIAAARGDDPGAQARWRELFDAHPDSVWHTEAALAMARQRFDEGAIADAARLLPADSARLAEAADRAEALWLESRIERARGRITRARELSATLRDRYAGTPPARAAADEAWSERAAVALASRRTAETEISRRLSEGDAPRAHALLEEARARFRSTADRAALAFLESRVLRALGRPADAERALRELRRRFPRRPEAAEALYRLAVSAWNRDDDEDALRDFEAYVRNHPREHQASESLYAIGRIHQEAGRFDEAIRAFSELRRRYPLSDLAPEAAWRIGWNEYQAGRHSRAAAAFASAAKGDERPGALYWRARSLEKIGKSADAAYALILREHPDSWYALLAESRTNRAEGTALAGHVPAPTAHPPLAAAGDVHLARYATLRDLGLPRLARRELETWERDRGSKADPAVLEAWIGVEGFREVVGRIAAQGGCRPPHALVRYCYPLAFWERVRRESASSGLDPYLVVSLMRQESLFDPRALSPANARGLMQLLPSTAERTARANGLDAPSDADLFEVGPNLRIGTTHLRELHDRYEGNVPRVLAAYNAGAAAVEKWDRRYPGVEDDEFVESISYRETRDYVKRVLRNRRIYRVLYPAESAAAAAPEAGPGA
jgi:soluble lytic murein transglycosylase